MQCAYVVLLIFHANNSYLSTTTYYIHILYLYIGHAHISVCNFGLQTCRLTRIKIDL